MHNRIWWFGRVSAWMHPYHSRLVAANKEQNFRLSSCKPDGALPKLRLSSPPAGYFNVSKQHFLACWEDWSKKIAFQRKFLDNAWSRTSLIIRLAVRIWRRVCTWILCNIEKLNRYDFRVKIVWSIILCSTVDRPARLRSNFLGLERGKLVRASVWSHPPHRYSNF